MSFVAEEVRARMKTKLETSLYDSRDMASGVHQLASVKMLMIVSLTALFPTHSTGLLRCGVHLIGSDCNPLEHSEQPLLLESLLISGGCQSCTSPPGGPVHCETTELQADWLLITEQQNAERATEPELITVPGAFKNVSAAHPCSRGFIFDGALITGHVYVLRTRYGGVPLMFTVYNERAVTAYGVISLLIITAAMWMFKVFCHRKRTHSSTNTRRNHAL